MTLPITEQGWNDGMRRIVAADNGQYIEPFSHEWWLRRLNRRLDARQVSMRRWVDYYDGRHAIKLVSERFRDEFAERFPEYADNFMPLVVDTENNRLHVQGIRYGDEPESDADAWVWWQDNHLDADASLAHKDALLKGSCNIVVWADGNDAPKVTIEDAMQTVVDTVPGRRWERRCALKRWVDDDSHMLAELYLPEAVYRYRSTEKVGTEAGLRWVSADWGGASEVRNPLGIIPIVPMIPRPRLSRLDASGAHLDGDDGESELAAVVGNQDHINAYRMMAMVASEYASFRQRYALNIDLPNDPLTGRPMEPFRIGVDRLWTMPPPDSEDYPDASKAPKTEFGEFEQTDTSGVLQLIQAELRRMATKAQMPYHFLLESQSVPPSGEALALDTPVQTPDGAVPIGEIAVGDEVFDERGEVQTVEHVFAVMEGRPCYRVTFDDGASLVADANHKWFTVDRRSRIKGLPGSVVTTAEIAASVEATYGNRHPVPPGQRGSRFNHAIPVAGALELQDVELPIEPYALGVWLGDGTAVHADVTQHDADVASLVANLTAVGVTTTLNGHRGNTSRFALGKTNSQGRCRRGHEYPEAGRCPLCANLNYRHRRYGEPLPTADNVSFRTKLIRLGVLGDKHIPAIYLRASHRQRLALLQGLMDTDGSTTPGGSVTLDLNDQPLAQAAHRLIQSLGHKVSLRQGVESRYGTPRWRMAWTAPEPVFRFPRKLARQKFATDGASRFRYVRSVEPVASVPVRCIAVSGPSHLFLVGDAYVPTHNSIKSAEAAFVMKIEDAQTHIGESWEEVFRLNFLWRGDPRGSVTDSEVFWQSPESRSEAVLTDAMVKAKTFGVEDELLQERWGMSPQEIERNRVLREERALDEAASAPEPPVFGSAPEQPPFFATAEVNDAEAAQ